MYFLFPFRPCFFWSFFVDSPFFSGITAPAALRRLEELLEACVRTHVRLPRLEIGVLALVDSDAFASLGSLFVTL
jgi:hypothetical protein